MKDEKLRNQNKIFENQFLKACMKMRKEMKHVGFKNGPPKVAMHAMREREREREREIIGPKGREILAGMKACSFEYDISLCLIYLSHKCYHFCTKFTQMILPNHVLVGQKMTPLLVEI